MFIDANNSTSFACPNCNAFFPFHLTVVNGLNRSTAKGDACVLAVDYKNADCNLFIVQTCGYSARY